MRNLVLIAILATCACVTPDQHEGVVTQAINDVCNQPFGIACYPGDPYRGTSFCNNQCGLWEGQQGYCPDYLQTDYDRCFFHCKDIPAPDGCDTNTCQPNHFNYCLTGETP